VHHRRVFSKMGCRERDQRSQLRTFRCPSFGREGMKPPSLGQNPCLPGRSLDAPHPHSATLMLSCETFTPIVFLPLLSTSPTYLPSLKPRYLGDGRFHLEAIMIANPSVPAFRYDPYSKKLTRERYNHREMRVARSDAVVAARKSIGDIAHKASAVDTSAGEAPAWGVVLGTLGRQGSFRQLQVRALISHAPRFLFPSPNPPQAITRQLTQSHTPIPYVPILLSELSPAKLSLFNPHISIFVQTSCPRLSIDWGYAFDRPLLSPYETALAIGKAKTEGWMDRDDSVYPMDFYAAGTPWAASRTTASFEL
jgi:2-(3-amino-3-carboxypropyl)histidine synthase